MKKIFTILFLFFLGTALSFAQDCTIGASVGSQCVFSADGILTIPAGVASVEVEAWGAGGSSNQGGTNDLSRAGGGGAAYYTNTYTVTAGNVDITVGMAMLSNNPGGSSTFDFGEGLVDVGGGGFGANSGGSGGIVMNGGTGTSVDGGDGGNRTNGSTDDAGGGGGGSGPGNADGGDAAGSTGGAAGAGGGGAGGNFTVAGTAGGFPGGGAGGKGDGSGGQSIITPGGAGQVIVTVTGVLPVKLVDFTANAKDDRILLEWQTASEVNNEGFEIQKSRDGITWGVIEFVVGKGNSSARNTYTSTDKTPNLGANYYRLKQMDLDGKFEYSNIISVDFTNRLNEVAIFPNPVKSQLTLINGEGQATIYNAMGQAIKQLNIDANQTNMLLSDLPNGQYYLQVVQTDGTVVTKQFAKTN